jgi:hypothetical protein
MRRQDVIHGRLIQDAWERAENDGRAEIALVDVMGMDHHVTDQTVRFLAAWSAAGMPERGWRIDYDPKRRVFDITRRDSREG